MAIRQVKLRKPIKRRRSKPRRIQGVRNPELVKWLHSRPCHRCCFRHQLQTTPTECAHIPGSRRFGDENGTWPLCADCHRLAKDSYHAGVKTFYATMGINRKWAELIARGYTAAWYRTQGTAA